MKYILTESQYNLLLEQTSGLDEFLVKVKEKYNIDAIEFHDNNFFERSA